ncbi:MAG: cell division protein FtsL [bacterium]
MARGATSISYTAKSVRRQPTFSPLDKSRRVFLFACLSLIVLASACAIFYIGTHIQAVNLGYNIGQELQRKEALIEENKRLSLEIARLKSPTRIENEAKDTLGLALPKTQQVFYLSRLDNETLARLSGAAPAPGGTNAAPTTVAEKIQAGPEKTAASVAQVKPQKPSTAPRTAQADKATAKPETRSAQAAVPTEIAKAEAPAAHPSKPAAAGPTKPQPKTVALQNKPQGPADRNAVAAPGKGTPTPAKLAQNSAGKPTSAAPPPSAAKPTRSDLSEKAETAPKKSVVAKQEAAAKPDRTLAAKGAGASPEAKAGPNEPTRPAKSQTAKNDLPKSSTPKSSARPKAVESRVVKGEDTDVLVAKIVSRETTRDKPANKANKDKVPAVMLDPLP